VPKVRAYQPDCDREPQRNMGLAEDHQALNDRLLIGEYQNEFDRKGRIHNKTLGYFVIELFELMISLTVTSLVFTVGDFQLSKVGIFAVIATLFSLCYFLVWSASIAVKYYRNHTLLVANIPDLLDADSNENIKSVLAHSIAENREINDRINKQNELLYAFLMIESFCFVAFIVSLVVAILKII
jgi:hypothetical protein